MSLHSSTNKIGTTEYLSQNISHATFQSTEAGRVQTTREVKTVTSEVTKHSEGISAGEIPKTIIYTDPSTQTRGGQTVIVEPSVTTSQVYGGSQLYGDSQAYGSHVYGAYRPHQLTGSQLYEEAVKVPELKEYGKGNILFRPMEARFFKNDGYSEMINPYCKVKIGRHSQKGSLSQTGGADVIWNDLIKLKRKHEKFAKLKCKDKNRVILHGKLGYCKVNLEEVAEKGKICGWFPLWHSENDDKVMGELLLEVQDLGVAGPTAV